MKKLKEIDPQEAVDFLIDQSKPYAKAKSERIYMEEFRKTLKAQPVSYTHLTLPTIYSV